MTLSEADEQQTSTQTTSSSIMEAPRYSCALAGAYATATGIYGVVPILHAGAGCGIAQLFGQFYAAGQNAGGPIGGTNTPCSSLVEEHVIFGGENKLRQLIQSTTELMNGTFYAVISGCVPSLIGDDMASVVREFRDQVPIVFVNTSGFKGTSYDGYELFFTSVIDQFLTALPVEQGTVNVFGIVPDQHIFWKGEARVIKETLAAIGVKANVILTEPDGLERLKAIPAAEYNLVLSPWNGHAIAELLKEKFNTPYLIFPGVPIGPKQTSAFLRTIAEALKIPADRVEAVIKKEEKRVYRVMEHLGDLHLLVRPHPYFAVVADAGTAVSITTYLTNEMGYLPEVVQITDNPPEEYHDAIVEALTGHLATPVRPEVIFEADSYRIRQNLKGRSFMFLYASSLEAPIAMEEFSALSLSVAFPTLNRLILERNYAGFTGGLTLMEDSMSQFAGPL